MDAGPLLSRIARMLEEHGLEAVLIGNAGFMFRKTPANLCKLKALAAGLDAVILRPYYPACAYLFRMVRDDDGLQIDFVSSVHGVRFLGSLRRRSDMIEFGQTPVVASLRTNVPVPEPFAKK